ncbi:MAG: hypothetical protein NTX30_04120 [Deltaproteobacteria bacterium]|nr:hypothetical protein [Deltaproteobacteria bacterium]
MNQAVSLVHGWKLLPSGGEIAFSSFIKEGKDENWYFRLNIRIGSLFQCLWAKLGRTDSETGRNHPKTARGIKGAGKSSGGIEGTIQTGQEG